MTWVGIAFDTCLLRSLESDSIDDYFKGIDIVADLRKSMKQGTVSMLLDHEGFILDEYKRNLPADRLGRKFVTMAIKIGAILHVSGALTSAAYKALVEHGVDNDDFSFIGVAQAVQGIYVTTEEKHLAAERRKLIADRCGVTVASLDQLSSLLTL